MEKQVNLPYGSPEFIGLGFSVMVFLVFIELFGSVFMKNCNVLIALLFGFMVAGLSDYRGQSYVLLDNIKTANAFTFLWMETFPIGFYPPAVIPLLIAYLVTSTETVGDIYAVYKVSGLSTDGTVYTESIQGGLTSDGLSSLLANLFTAMPLTSFAQNNGVIGLTKCASRRAGYACGFLLILMGVFSKIAGIITAIPDCVLGGMTIFLFSNVLASGIALAATVELHSRRVKFIMAMSLAIGVGVTIWPFAFADMRGSTYTANFWRCDDCNPTMQGVRNGVSILLSTGYCIGTIVAILLNAILPDDAGVNMTDVTGHNKKLAEDEQPEGAAPEGTKVIDHGDESEVGEEPMQEFNA
jgi:uric acid-xanthine permease